MRRELKILLLAASLFLLAGGLFGPVYAVFVEEIGGNLLIAGSAYGLFSIITGVLIFLISRWEDHIKYQEKLVIVGYLMSSLGYLGLIFVRAPIHLFIIESIFGIGTAVQTPAYDGLYSKHLDRGKFASEWGLWESMYYIVTAIAATIGGFLANTYGFKVLFLIMFVLSILGLFVSLLLLKSS